MPITTIHRSRTDLLKRLPKNAVCAELGVFRGDFSQEIIDHCSPSKLYLVDLWQGVVYSGDRNGENIVPIQMHLAIHQVRARFTSYPAVNIVQSDSVKFLMSVPKGTLDWVYIDTNHTYELTQKELIAASQSVKQGGIIAGHDYSEGFPGVVRAVNEFCAERDLDLELWTLDGMPSFRITI